MPDLTLFIDDGGVLSDNAQRAQQWPRLVGAFFAPRLGGARTAWAEANRAIFARVLDAHLGALAAGADYARAYDAFERDWLTAMCRHVGVPPPRGEECATLAREAGRFVTARVRAAFAGAAETVVALSASGFTLHTASNGPSWELEGYLTGMGVRERFDLLIGPDLVAAMKPARDYYARAFALAGVSPSRALVLDDSATHLAAAREAGARTVLVGTAAAASAERAIPSLAALPPLLETLG